MTTRQTTLYVDLTQNKLNFTSWGDDCTEYFPGLGWKASTACNGGQALVAYIVTTAYPIAFNQRIVGLEIDGTYSGPRGTLTGIAGLSAVENGTTHAIIPNLGGSFSYSVQVDSGGYGIQAPMLLGANALPDGIAQLYLTGLKISVIEDDSLQGTNPPIIDNGPPLQVANPGCNVNVVYQYGIGPNCIAEGDIVAVKSAYTNAGNLISFTLDTTIDILFLYEQFWYPDEVVARPYIFLYHPISVVSEQFEIAAYDAPHKIPISLAADKVLILGPVSGTEFIQYFKVVKVYSGAPGTPNGLPTDFNAVTVGIDGIKQAIIDETTTIGEKFVDTTTSVKDGFNSLINDLPKGLIAGLISGITGIPEGTVTTLLGNVKIPQAWSDDIINWLVSIGSLIETEVKTAGPALLDELNKRTTDFLNLSVSEIQNSDSAETAVINKLLNGNYANADQFYNDLNANFPTGAMLVLLQNIITIFSGVFSFVHAKSDIVEITIKQLLLSQYTPINNDMTTNVRAYFKGLINRNQLDSFAGKVGLDTTRTTELIEAYRPIPSLQEIKDGYLRGYITQQTHDNYLTEYGFNQLDIEYIKRVYQTLLGPSDLTRMGDKHVFSNDIPQYFGQGEELDQGLIDNMSKWGITPDMTLDYWKAHWSLPAPEQIFDMFHRGFFDDSVVNDYFKLTDILPYFREQYKKLSYSLIGRVDIRRFYAEGIYSQAEVLDAYKRLGYSDVDAQKQTDFTIEHERQSEAPAKVKVRALTESMVVKAYKSGNISHDDAIARLGNVGYLPADAETILKLETQIANTSILADKTQHYHDRAVTLVIDSLSKGTISENDARGYLQTLGVPQAEIESEIAYADIDRITHLKQIVVDKIKTSYEQGMVDKPSTINFMLTQGFSMNEVQVLLNELDIILQLRNKPLTEKQIEDLYNAGIISANDVAIELTNLGYTEKHVNWLLAKIVGVA